jgi:formyltetrahydrofolate hydrolase
LLFRYKSGLLPVEIKAIVSNHTDFYQLAASYNIPFHHLPLAAGASAEAKRAQEEKVLEIVAANQADLVVLARYMQICRRRCVMHSKAKRSIFITLSCLALKVRNPIIRRMNVA